MNYQTFLNQASDWLFSDPTHWAYVIGAFALVGAINGVRLSMRHCRFTGRRGMKVL